MKITIKLIKKPKILQRLTGLNQGQIKKLTKCMKLPWNQTKKIIDKVTEFGKL